MARPTLDLTPELPEVRSEDFNLFYKPEVKPLPAGLEQFSRSLSAFVSDGMVDAYVVSEKKKKKEGEAEAEKAYRETEENKKGFNQQVNTGKIPKEANPYFIDKYKELELNAKADKFKAKVFIEYANKNVAENPDPEAFQKFYKNELKLFIGKNQLGSFDAVELEKGFFTKTSAMKAQLFNTHVQTQMGKISEQFKTNFTNNIQGMFDNTQSIETIGENVSTFVKGAVKNGLSKATAQQYILDALTDYAENTGDFNYAQKVLSELPKHIMLGTDSLGNVKGLKDDFYKIKEALQDREDQKEQDDNTRIKNQRETESLEANDIADNYSTLTDAMATDEWKNASNYKKDQIKKVYAGYTVGFSTQTDPNVDSQINAKLAENDIQGAMELLTNSIPVVQSTYFNKKKEEIDKFRISGKDGLLAIKEYKYAHNRIVALTKKAADAVKSSTIKVGYDGMADEKFRIKAIEWLADNPTDDIAPRFYNNSKRRQDFEKFLQDELAKEEQIIIQTIKGENYSFGNQETETADMSKIQTKKITTEKSRITTDINIGARDTTQSTIGLKDDDAVIKNPKLIKQKKR